MAVQQHGSDKKMAKIMGPLHSMGATGSIGHSITFQGVSGRSRAIQYTKPSGTGNAVRKALYSAGCAAWAALSEGQKTDWRQAARMRRITGFNAFVGAYMLGEITTGTTWDAGSTTWDAGTTTWDA
jgi:hypothetical protein